MGSDDLWDTAITEAKAAATGSLPSRCFRFWTSGWALTMFSSAPLTPCSRRETGFQGMTSFVLSPLRDSAPEGQATASAIERDAIGTLLALSVTDFEKAMFYSSCFSSARGTDSATGKVF